MPRRSQGPRLRFLDKRGVYYICWTEGGRSRERSTGTEDRGDAEIALAEFLHARQRTGGPRDPSEILITDALADYASEVGPTTDSPERMGYAVAPLTDFWACRFASSITPETCRAYGRWRDRSDGTIRRELGVLRAALNHAHSEGRITRQIPVKLPEAPPPKERWLERREAAALLRVALASPKARLHLPLFILIGLYTGKRKEAILSLRWGQVNLETERIDWNPPGRRRTKKQRPRNAIPKRLLPHLRRARQRGSDTGFVIHVNGHPIKDVKTGFKSACRRAGLDDVSPHTLRHTCATWLMQRGVDKWQACGFLGMTMETLEKNYGHHHPDYEAEAANAF